MYRQESENIIEITNIEMCDKPVTEYYAFKYPDQPGTTGIQAFAHSGTKSATSTRPSSGCEQPAKQSLS